MFIIVQDLSFNIINWASERSRQSSVFFFGKTTEILGKTNFGEKKISVDFFLPRKINSHFSRTELLYQEERRRRKVRRIEFEER